MSLAASVDPARRDGVLRTSLVVAAIALATYLFTEDRLPENLRAFGVLSLFLLGVFFERAGQHWTAWACVLSVMLAGIAMNPLDVPNHHYLLTYITAAVALSLTGAPEDRETLLRTNARWLIVALMSVATLQRLLSPQFLDGSYLGFELATGGFGKPLLPFLGQAATVAADNNVIVEAFRARPPWEVSEVVLGRPWPWLPVLAKGFAATILGIEAWVAFVMWRFPTRPISHLSLWTFAITLACLRQEMMFITVLCALGLMACSPTMPRVRFGYAVLVCVFAATVVKVA